MVMPILLRPFAILAAIALAGLLSGATAAQNRVVPPGRAELQFSFAPVVRSAAPAVVNI